MLDLDHGGSGVIGDRAFDRDPRVVSMLATGLMHGLLQAGMHNCGKHFPGHGFVRADSHHEIPIDERSLETILADDARPYEWLAGTLASVMPAHVIYPRVDDRPAGFSPRWLREILRLALGFDGAIFSDDLSMAGARRIGGVEVTYAEAAALALAAGCDMVLLCNQSTTSGAAVDALLDDLLDAAAHSDGSPTPTANAPARPPAATDPDRLGRADALAGLPALARVPALRRLKARGARPTELRAGAAIWRQVPGVCVSNGSGPAPGPSSSRRERADPDRPLRLLEISRGA